jgi:DNA-directed RNA polymerase subunit beta
VIDGKVTGRGLSLGDGRAEAHGGAGFGETNADGSFVEELVSARQNGEFVMARVKRSR